MKRIRNQYSRLAHWDDSTKWHSPKYTYIYELHNKKKIYWKDAEAKAPFKNDNNIASYKLSNWIETGLEIPKKKPTKDKDNNRNNILDPMSFVEQSYFIVHLCIGINMLQNVFKTMKKKKRTKNAPPFNVLKQPLP